MARPLPVTVYAPPDQPKDSVWNTPAAWAGLVLAVMLAVGGAQASVFSRDIERLDQKVQRLEDQGKAEIRLADDRVREAVAELDKRIQNELALKIDADHLTLADAKARVATLEAWVRDLQIEQARGAVDHSPSTQIATPLSVPK